MSYYNPLGHYEARHALAWDQETIVSELDTFPQDAFPELPPVSAAASNTTSIQALSSQQRLPHLDGLIDISTPRPGSATHAPPSTSSSPPRSYSLAEVVNRSARSRNAPSGSSSKPAQAPARRKTQSGSRYNPQRGPPGKPTSKNQIARDIYRSLEPKGKEIWPKRNALLTTREKDAKDEEAARAAKDSKYVGKLEIHNAAVTGVYLWPERFEEPFDLLGKKLQALDRFRNEHQVVIKWDSHMRNFVIASKSADHGLADVSEAIISIRGIIRHAKALATSAPPLHIVEPPSVQTIRTVVRPVFRDTPVDYAIVGSPTIIGFQLDGPKLGTAERVLWNGVREKLQKENLGRLRAHLIMHIGNLGPIQDWMRLRLHFGNLELLECSGDFLDTNLGFESFSQKLSANLFKTNFNKQIGKANVALDTRNKLAHASDIISPADPMIPKIEDIPPKHTIIIFATSKNGQEYRVEAEVDVVKDNRASTYQFGATKYYVNSHRNKHLEVIDVDVDKGLDWILEIVTDRPASTVPRPIQELIKSSITSATVERKDSFGLKYPGVTPRYQAGCQVKNIAVRSAFQYLKIDSNFIIDVSVYREWSGMKTKGEPKMMSSVSMFHPGWAGAMEAIESTEVRAWDRELKTFFPATKDKDGLEVFLKDVQWVRDLLSRTSKDLKSNSNLSLDCV